MRPCWPRLALLSVLLAAAFGRSAPAQSPAGTPAPESPLPRVTFGVEVSYVEIDAIVTDAAGRPVRDLKQEDFVVEEDGKRQAIELFTQIDVPYERPERGAPPPLPVDVQSNARPFEGRLYVLVLDGQHTAALRTPLVRAAARRFLEQHFTDGDLAAVVHTSGGDASGQGLTGNRALLLAAVDRFIGRKLPSVTQSRIEEYRRTQETRDPTARVGDPDDSVRAFAARATLDTLQHVADWLSSIHGRRKAVLVLSEGIDYDIYDSVNSPEAGTIVNQVRDAITAATRANASFYTVDPRGLGADSGEMMQIQPVFDDPTLGLTPEGVQSDVRRSQDSLRVLAEETSGLAAVNTNDLTGAFDKLVRDSSAYYLLGYYPPNQKRDGRTHKLSVKVTRPGLKVRARNAYMSPRGKRPQPPPVWARPETPPRIVELLRMPIPEPGLPLTVQAAAFRGPSNRSSVMVVVQAAAGSFRFGEEKAGVSKDTLEMTVVAIDNSGKVTGSDHKVDLAVQAQTRKVVEAGGFRMLSWLTLAPGRYQIRVAGRAVNKDLSGSVHTDIDVPDFGKDNLALSGIALTSAIARVVPTAGDWTLLKDALPGAPTTWRAFPANDRLALVTEIYPGEKSEHTLDVVTTLTSGDGTVAYRSADERKVPALRGKEPRPAVLHTAQLPLRSVAPGTYTLRVAVTSRMGRDPQSAERVLALAVLAVDPAPEPGVPVPEASPDATPAAPAGGNR